MTSATSTDLARVLEGCWRPQPPPLRVEVSRVAELAPLLAGCGAGALAWCRLRRQGLGDSAGRSGLGVLRQAHIQQALEAQMQEGEIAQALRLLRTRGIEPLLAKGWACARLYPEPGLRPAGDIDLLVRPEHGAATAEALGVPVDSAQGQEVDIKTSLLPLYGLSVADAMSNGLRVPLGRSGELQVLVLGAEDELRLLCLHFLRHGAWRPLWLCDIAAALEARPPSFDWERCLGPRDSHSGRVRAGYVASALELAHRLLGAEVAGTPIAQGASRVPPWLAPAVLRQWENPTLAQHAPPPLWASVPRRPAPLLHALRQRWPNPIESAVALGQPLEASPLPAQCRVYAAAVSRFAVRRAK